jgi:hypothetical protein
MFKRLLIPTLLILTIISSCKKDEPTYDYNLSATTWKGTHKVGSGTSFYTLIFLADRTFDGNLNINGAPQKITGTWTQDRNKVSTQYAIVAYVGTWRGEGEISEDKKNMHYKGFHSASESLNFTMDVTLQ